MGAIQLLCFLFFWGFSYNINAQSGLCDPNVPFYVADLTASPNATWVSPSDSRQGNCCGTSFPDRCIEFEITLHPGAIGINFEIASGAVPPGALYYQINCGPLIHVGDPICLVGQGPHVLTFCKPGNNQNTYQITSIPNPQVSPPQVGKDDCSTEIWVDGLAPTSILWQDVTYGGLYDSFLSCTDCEQPTVTPVSPMPPYVDYEVCGTPISSLCDGLIIFCDTVRVYFFDSIVPSIDPSAPLFCSSDSGVLITGMHTGGVPPFVYQWYDQNGNLADTTTSFFATEHGSYTLAIYDSLFPDCPPTFHHFFVTESPTYEFTSNAVICDGEVFYWQGQSYTLPGTYYDSLTTIDGCDSVFILNLSVMPSYEFVESAAICDGETYQWRGQNLTQAGTYYDSLLTAHGCDSIFILNLTVHPAYEFIENGVICEGEVYMWRGNAYIQSGTYYDSLQTIDGCDSLFVLELTVSLHYEIIEDAQVCDGDSLFWRGDYYTTGGVYYDSLLTVNGCDSVFILNFRRNRQKGG